jgi:hypothetical protein
VPQCSRKIERRRGSDQWLGGPIAAIIDTADDYTLVALPGAIADSPLAGGLSASGDRHRALIVTTNVKT